MADIFIFKRIEKKYRINSREKDALLSLCGDLLVPDAHGRSTISSLYLDTPSHLLVRNSIDAKVYKEKLRIRSYGTPKLDDKIFFEIKKKFEGVVYKRRVSMTLDKAYDYIADQTRPEESQIMSEIDYTMRFYGIPKPSMLVSYEREAYFVKNEPNLRLTFDNSVRYRENDLFLEKGSNGKEILDKDEFILEIKTDGAMPLWLAHILDELTILPSSFSKYGTSYLDTLKKDKSPDMKGEKEYALAL